MENYINPLLRRISSSRHLKFDPPTSIAESFCPIEINHFPPSSLHALALFQTHSWFTATHSSYSSHRYNPTWKFQIALFCKALGIYSCIHPYMYIHYKFSCSQFRCNFLPKPYLLLSHHPPFSLLLHILHIRVSCAYRHSIHDFWHTGCMRVLISWYHTN